MEAIDSLSQQFEENVKREKRTESSGIIILLANDNLILQGEKILSLYMAEDAKSDDPDVKLSLAQHHFRMGVMYSEAILPRWITTNNPAASIGGAEAAQRACQHYHHCWELSKFRFPAAAGALGDTFGMAEFHATALHWYDKAEQAAIADGQADGAAKVRAIKLLLESDGRTSDPVLSPDKLFPKMNTPGLLLENQPAPSAQSTLKSNDSPTTSKGGCASMLVCIFVVAPILATILTR